MVVGWVAKKRKKQMQYSLHKHLTENMSMGVVVVDVM